MLGIFTLISPTPFVIVGCGTEKYSMEGLGCILCSSRESEALILNSFMFNVSFSLDLI